MMAPIAANRMDIAFQRMKTEDAANGSSLALLFHSAATLKASQKAIHETLPAMITDV
jgi:hypothetical protein